MSTEQKLREINQKLREIETGKNETNELDNEPLVDNMSESESEDEYFGDGISRLSKTPAAIVENVASFLGAKDLAALGLTSQNLYNVLNQPEVWRYRYRTKWPDDEPYMIDPWKPGMPKSPLCLEDSKSSNNKECHPRRKYQARLILNKMYGKEIGENIVQFPGLDTYDMIHADLKNNRGIVWSDGDGLFEVNLKTKEKVSLGGPTILNNNSFKLKGSFFIGSNKGKSSSEVNYEIWNTEIGNRDSYIGSFKSPNNNNILSTQYHVSCLSNDKTLTILSNSTNKKILRLVYDIQDPTEDPETTEMNFKSSNIISFNNDMMAILNDTKDLISIHSFKTKNKVHEVKLNNPLVQQSINKTKRSLTAFGDNIQDPYFIVVEPKKDTNVLQMRVFNTGDWKEKPINIKYNCKYDRIMRCLRIHNHRISISVDKNSKKKSFVNDSIRSLTTGKRIKKIGDFVTDDLTFMFDFMFVLDYILYDPRQHTDFKKILKSEYHLNPRRSSRVRTNDSSKRKR